jgi:hypothetical protein
MTEAFKALLEITYSRERLRQFRVDRLVGRAIFNGQRNAGLGHRDRARLRLNWRWVLQ